LGFSSHLVDKLIYHYPNTKPHRFTPDLLNIHLKKHSSDTPFHQNRSQLQGSKNNNNNNNNNNKRVVNFSHGKETEAENAGILCKLDKYASSHVAIIYFYLLTSSPRTLRPVNHSD